MLKKKLYNLTAVAVIVILTALLFNGCASQTIQPSETINGFVPLAEVPADYPFEEATQRGDVVNLHGELSNMEAYEKFKGTIEKSEPTFMRFVAYTIEGDPILMDVNFDGTLFQVTHDVSRDAFAGGIDKVMSYTYEGFELLEDGRIRLHSAAATQPIPGTEAPQEVVLPLGM
ncbi:DUF4362 domain-containing protein [Acidaminobacter hydrogenoformans]|uniref:Uncharacterized protein n=1 Tax=Acidaminobacter hydrogenoformans DSM 2784 TaxID=1120920 RepID=A0A1G5RT72_9FIRM|nr:DUF4362 domain-containing protein [Acidaminobacter hydrogenoformans]SCZ77312.1 protein of unknown function [Acidaminobacter hydrogenoformans DSM 2784]